MIILGIDPGTTRIGFGVIESVNNKLRCLGYGLISPEDSNKNVTAKKILVDLDFIIKKYNPDIAAVEKLFFFNNQKTIISVSEMRGVILAGLALKNLSIKEFTPLQVKQAVTNYGRADKNQVQRMVRLILSVSEEIKPDDAADGLAIAICCANTIV